MSSSWAQTKLNGRPSARAHQLSTRRLAPARQWPPFSLGPLTVVQKPTTSWSPREPRRTLHRSPARIVCPFGSLKSGSHFPFPISHLAGSLFKSQPGPLALKLLASLLPYLRAGRPSSNPAELGQRGAVQRRLLPNAKCSARAQGAKSISIPRTNELPLCLPAHCCPSLLATVCRQLSATAGD